MKIFELLCQTHKNEIWHIDSVISKIFEYSTFQDLKTFNIVCKKWNQLTNPIIHGSIKLSRRFCSNNAYGYWNIDAEVGKCIINYAKHASFVKSFCLSTKLKPCTTIEFFKTFKYLEKLNIANIEITQDQFLHMVKTLDKLEELDLNHVKIKVIKKSLYKEHIQLPQTLSKLSISNINIIGNSITFIKTINSHSDLKEVAINSCSINDFLIPFNSHYPSLKALKYEDNSSKNNQYLIKTFKSNPQLLKLSISLDCYDHSLDSSVKQCLTNLQEITFSENLYYHLGDQNAFNKPSIPKNVKKLKLNCREPRLCLLGSIFNGCSELSEFIFKINESVIYSKSLSLKTGIPSKIEKLKISNDILDESILDAILINCSNLTELDIFLPKKWESYFEIINKRCPSLERLILQPVLNSRFDEYSSLEFLSKKFSFKNTLTRLIIYKFKYELIDLNYIEYYPKLNFIKLINQPRFIFNSRFDKTSNSFTFGKSDLETGFVTDSYPDYKVRMYNHTAFTYDVDVSKVHKSIPY